jgi:hypothetical protein
MTDAISETVNTVGDTFTGVMDESVKTIQNPQTWLYPMGGLVAGALVGGGLAFIPFHLLGAVGPWTRSGIYLLSGAGLIGYGINVGGDYGRLTTVAGAVVGGAGLAQVFGLFNVPGFRTIGSLLTNPSQAFASDERDLGIVTDPEAGVGRVLGQVGPDYDYRDINNAENTFDGTDIDNSVDEFVEATATMQNRYEPSNIMSSYVEGSTAAGTITQDFGAEGLSTGFQANNDMTVDDYANATDTLGLSKREGANPFLQSIHPSTPAYQPPVWYAEDIPEVAVKVPTASGGLDDIFSSYMYPGTTADENPFLLSIAMPSAGGSGHGVTFDLGAEEGTSYHGTIGRHVSAASGRGNVIGQ